MGEHHPMWSADLAVARALLHCMAEKHVGYIYHDDLSESGGTVAGYEGKCIRVTVEWVGESEPNTL